MTAGQNQASVIRSHNSSNSSARPVQQRLIIHEGTELLGPLVAGNPLRQRPEPHPLASCEDECPPVRSLRPELHLLLLIALSLV
jgi:hypothetical protein